MWQSNCAQLSKFDKLMVKKDNEITALREQLMALSAPSSSTSAGTVTFSRKDETGSGPTPPQRKGKAPC